MVNVEPAAGQVEEGLGHEGGAVAVGDGELFDHPAESDGSVSCLQGVAIADVDLDLAGGVLGVGLFDGDPGHAEVIADRSQDMLEFHGPLEPVDLDAFVSRLEGLGVDQKELDLGSDLHLVTHCFGPIDDPAQDVAGVDRHQLAPFGPSGPEHEGGARVPWHGMQLVGQGSHPDSRDNRWPCWCKACPICRRSCRGRTWRWTATCLPRRSPASAKQECVFLAGCR